MPQLLACNLLACFLLAPHQITQDSASAASREVVTYDIGDIVEQGGTSPVLIELLKNFGPLDEEDHVMVVTHEGAVQPLFGVLATGTTHAWIREWLALQRGTDMIEVHARFIRAPRGRFEELGLDTSARSGLDPAQREQLLAALGSEDFELLSAPRVLNRSGSRAQVTTHQEISYVKDWRLVEVEPGPREIAVPLIDSVEEGIGLEVLGTLLPGGELGLDLAVSHSKLQRPIETHQVRLRPDDEETVELALPEVTRLSLTSRVVLADGAAILLGTLVHEPDHRLAVMIEARVVRPRIERADGEGDEQR